MKYLTLAIYFCLFYCVRNEEDVKVITPEEHHNERPCKTKDLKCIRKEFMLRGWCLQSIGMKQAAERPLKVAEVEFPLPYFKVTAVQKNLEVYGLHEGEVMDFFINKETGSAVLCINFSDINVYSHTTFSLHRKCKQDIIVHAPTTSENYTSIITTTQIKGSKLKSSQKTDAEVCEPPTYSFGNLDHVKDKEVLALIEYISLHVEVGVAEMYISRAQKFADFYIQNVICNVFHGKKHKENENESSEEDHHDKKHKVTITHNIGKH